VGSLLLTVVVYVLTYVGSKTFCLSPAILMKLLIMMEYILHMSITTKKNNYIQITIQIQSHKCYSFFHFCCDHNSCYNSEATKQRVSRPGLYGCIQIMQRQPNRLASIVSRWCKDSPHNQNIGITVSGAWKQLMVTSSFHAKKKSSVILS